MINSSITFERLDEVISSFNRTFASVYPVTVRILERMARFASGLSRWIQNLLMTRFAGYPPPTVAFESPMTEEALLHGFDLIKLCLVWKSPANLAIPRILDRIRSAARRLSSISRERMLVPFLPRGIAQPPTTEVIKTATGSVSRFLEVSHLARRTPSIVKAATAVGYAEKVSQAYRRKVLGALAARAIPFTRMALILSFVEAAGKEALRVSSKVLWQAERKPRIALLKVEELVSRVAEGRRPSAKLEKGLQEVTGGEAVALPSARKEPYAWPQIKEAMTVAPEPASKMAYAPVTMLLPAFAGFMGKAAMAEAFFSAAPVVERRFRGAMEKGYEALWAGSMLTGYPVIVVDEALEVSRRVTTVGSAVMESSKPMYYLSVLGTEFIISSYKSEMGKAVRRSFTVFGDTFPKVVSPISELGRTVVRGLSTAGVLGLIEGLTGAVAERLYMKIEAYGLEETVAGLPIAPQMLRLHEVAALISVLSTVSQPSRAPRVQRPLNVTVRVESLTEDRDLRELERKIAKILRDAARRYGVPL